MACSLSPLSTERDIHYVDNLVEYDGSVCAIIGSDMEESTGVRRI